jgi:hypothetical protein
MRTVILVLIGAFALAISISVSAQQTAPKTAPTATSTPMMAGQSSRMAAMHDTSKKLEDLVQQLNAAKGNDRIDRLVAVVNELAAEQLRMNRMTAMHGRMMQPAATPDAEHSSHHPGTTEDVQK